MSLWASGWASGEQERHNADGHKSGVKILQFLFGLQLPLTRKPWVTLFEPFTNKARGIFCWRSFHLSVIHCVSMYPAWTCKWLYNNYFSRLFKMFIQSCCTDRIQHGGARGVMVIVVGTGHGNTSSNPGRDWLHFT